MTAKEDDGKPVIRTAKLVDVDKLRPHPRNYRDHPDDEIAHLIHSMREHGVYKNVVATRDGTLLAGHGVIKAAKQIGLKRFPVTQLDVDANDPEALRLLVGDNEQGALAERDDRVLTEILKELHTADELLGTGFDELQLANLVFVTRSAAEVADFDAAAHWVGMPDYEEGQAYFLNVMFENEADRVQFMDKHGLEMSKTKGCDGARAWSIRWPDVEKRDRIAVKFEA